MKTKEQKIIKAWWISQNKILAVFERDLRDLPNISFLDVGDVGRFDVKRASCELFSEYSSYYSDLDSITFVLRSTEAGHISSNMDYYVCGSFNGWGEAIGKPEWKMKKCGEGMNLHFTLTVPLVRGANAKKIIEGGAWVDASKKGDILFKFCDSFSRWIEPSYFSPNISVDAGVTRNFRIFRDYCGSHMIEVEFESYDNWLVPIKISAEGMGEPVSVDSGTLLRQLYSNRPLGTYLKNGKTEFSIFAPRAISAKVVWRNLEDNSNSEIIAEKLDGAVWVARADKDLSGARYMWRIDGVNFDSTTDFNPEIDILDPYALVVDSSKGWCVVSYVDDVVSPKSRFNPPAWHDLVIMESHVRDILAKAYIDLISPERLTFDGLAKWLALPDCYFRKVGVNCVELQPVQEFTAENPNDYEWGYMPVNWFAPESSFARDIVKSTQREDFRKLIEAFHDAGIAVILDVVYNHVGEPNYLMRADKEYYFDLSPEGHFMNYSGCGNDFRSDTPMSRRLIIDSLKYYVEKFDVDGFRFDLAELVGVSTLVEIERVLKKIKPSIILIAEPWSFRGRISGELANTGWASWNDGFREFMLKYALGQGNFDGFKFFIGGSRGFDYRFPAQTVNYLESHDDMCLFDRISQNRDDPTMEDLRRFRMALSLVLLSIGIPMIAEGCDIVRTKEGKHNTYKDGQANALDYLRGSRFTGVSTWVRNFIEFRLSECARALRLSRAQTDSFFEYFGSDGTAGGVLFNADNSVRGKKILAFYNPDKEYRRVNLNMNVIADFTMIADIDRFDARGIDASCQIITADDEKYGRITSLKLPPVSFQLWVSKK